MIPGPSGEAPCSASLSRTLPAPMSGSVASAARMFGAPIRSLRRSLRGVPALGHDRAEFTDGPPGQLLCFLLAELNPVLVFDPDGELGQRQRLEIGAPRPELGAGVDAVDVVVHLPERFDDELLNSVVH